MAKKTKQHVTSEEFRRILEGLAARREQVEAQIAKLDEQGAGSVDVDVHASLRHERNLLQSQLAAIADAEDNAQAGLLQAIAEEAKEQERRWVEEQRPRVVADMDSAIQKVVDKLAEAAEAYKQYQNIYYEAQRAWHAAGRPQPEVPGKPQPFGHWVEGMALHAQMAPASPSGRVMPHAQRVHEIWSAK